MNYDKCVAESHEEKAKTDEQLAIIARAKIRLWKMQADKSDYPPDEYVYYFDQDGIPACFKIKNNIKLSKTDFEQLINCLMHLRYEGMGIRYYIAAVDYIFGLLGLDVVTESDDLFEDSGRPISRSEFLDFIRSDWDHL